VVRFAGLAGLAAVAAARAGRRAEAARLDSALARAARPFAASEPLFWRAAAAAALGDREGALARLREAFARGAADPTWRAVHREPAFAALRDDPELRELMNAAR